MVWIQISQELLNLGVVDLTLNAQITTVADNFCNIFSCFEKKFDISRELSLSLS